MRSLEGHRLGPHPLAKCQPLPTRALSLNARQYAYIQKQREAAAARCGPARNSRCRNGQNRVWRPKALQFIHSCQQPRDVIGAGDRPAAWAVAEEASAVPWAVRTSAAVSHRPFRLVRRTSPRFLAYEVAEVAVPVVLVLVAYAEEAVDRTWVLAELRIEGLELDCEPRTYADPLRDDCWPARRRPCHLANSNCSLLLVTLQANPRSSYFASHWKEALEERPSDPCPMFASLGEINACRAW